MKMMTPGADIKRFPLMTEASLISAGSRIDRRTVGWMDGWMDAEYTIHKEESWRMKKLRREEDFLKRGSVGGSLGVPGTEEMKSPLCPLQI